MLSLYTVVCMYDVNITKARKQSDTAHWSGPVISALIIIALINQHGVAVQLMLVCQHAICLYVHVERMPPIVILRVRYNSAVSTRVTVFPWNYDLVEMR